VIALAYDAVTARVGDSPADFSLQCAFALTSLALNSNNTLVNNNGGDAGAAIASANDALVTVRTLITGNAQMTQAQTTAAQTTAAHPLPWLLWALTAAHALTAHRNSQSHAQSHAGNNNSCSHSTATATVRALRAEALGALSRALSCDGVTGQRPLPLAWAMYAVVALEGAVDEKALLLAVAAASPVCAASPVSASGHAEAAAGENKVEAELSIALAAAEAAVNAGIATDRGDGDSDFDCGSADECNRDGWSAWTALKTVFEARGLWEVVQ